MISVGQPAPAFDALATTGQQVSLAKLRGKVVVLYFFPKAFTSG
jgi:peroxiredoxin Q/BCP